MKLNKHGRLTTVVLVILLVLITSSCGALSLSTTGKDSNEPTSDMLLEEELLAYIKSIQQYSHVSVGDITRKIANGESFILYTGRLTCDWCRKLSPLLCEIATENDLTIYYLDSENTDKDEALKNFRDEYSIATVPSIIIFGGISDHIAVNLEEFYDLLSKEALLDLLEPHINR